uniref:Uncharacterized protein n=1 Tax=Steinernema glaseri TaxID=37863 RepID=A0A1I8AHD6_9BILA
MDNLCPRRSREEPYPARGRQRWTNVSSLTDMDTTDAGEIVMFLKESTICDGGMAKTLDGNDTKLWRKS